MVTLILVWILNAVALLAVAYLLPGIAAVSYTHLTLPTKA